MVKEFYIYGFVDPVTKEIFYIGKGKSRRFRDISSRVYNIELYNKLKKIRENYKPKEYTIFLEENLTEQEAFTKEKFYIKKYGRVDTGTGILLNRTCGGPGYRILKPHEKAQLPPKGELSRLEALRRVKEGTHNFLGGKTSRKINKKRVQDGTHNLLNHGGKYADKHPCLITCSDGRSWQFESNIEGVRQGFSAWLFEVLRKKNPYTITKKTVSQGRTKFCFKKGDVLTYKLLKK